MTSLIIVILALCDGFGFGQNPEILPPASLLRFDSLNVRFIGQCNTPGHAQNVFVNGSYAYVADYDAGLRIIDVSTPTLPYEVGACDSADIAIHVVVHDSHAYVAARLEGLKIVNIHDPLTPVLIGNFPVTTSDGLFNVACAYPYAFVMTSKC